MDLTLLIPFLVKQANAGLSVSPEEVYAQMQKQQQKKLEDKDRETVDNEVVEQDERPSDDLKNDEGNLMEGSFKELEVEDAIDKAKEEKLLATNPEVSSTSNAPAVKVASYWEVLQSRLK